MVECGNKGKFIMSFYILKQSFNLIFQCLDLAVSATIKTNCRYRKILSTFEEIKTPK